MPKRNSIPVTRLHISLPMDLLARITADLYSEAEGRVPKGAYQDFFCTLVRDFYREKDARREARP